jgi:hypothetical protein
MGRQGKGLSIQEQNKIKELFDHGVRPLDIASKINRSANSVYWYLRTNGITVKRVFQPLKKKEVITFKSEDLSSLPDNYLFRHIKYAIP